MDYQAWKSYILGPVGVVAKNATFKPPTLNCAGDRWTSISCDQVLIPNISHSYADWLTDRIRASTESQISSETKFPNVLGDIKWLDYVFYRRNEYMFANMTCCSLILGHPYQDHVMRCENSATRYESCPSTSRLSLVIPLKATNVVGKNF